MTDKQGDEGGVVEIDAMDEAEWEKDAHTPMVQNEQLSKLVKASAADRSKPTVAPPAPPTLKRTANTVTKKAAPPAAPTTKDATPAKPTAGASGPVKRPIRPAAAPPSASLPPSAPNPVATTTDSSSSAPLPRAKNDSSSSAVQAVADPPSGSARRPLPLPPPRPAGRTNAPPIPSRTATKAGGFAFAASTPVEPSKIETRPKPVEAEVPAAGFDRDEDLAIPRTASGEAVVIATPIRPTRDSLEKLQPLPPEDAPTVATPPLEVGPNPFDEDVWRAEGGSDSSADVDIAGAHAPIATSPLRDSIEGFARNKRNIAIAGGALVVSLIVLVVLMSGGGSKPSAKHASNGRATKAQPSATKSDKKTETPSTETPLEAPTEIAGAEAGSAEAPSEAPPDETPTGEPPPTDDTSSADTAHAKHANESKPKKTSSTLAGKQVVLEYDTQARESKPVANAPKDDQAAIARARTSYAAGNTRLFAGDADGAIRNYRQALAYYPAYVGAYRGLGLAYAQKGDNAAAVKALRTYVSAAPGAKDAAIIRKRIQSLK